MIPSGGGIIPGAAPCCGRVVTRMSQVFQRSIATFSIRRRRTFIMIPKLGPRVRILNEDIQIVRATLEHIVEDVRSFSETSAEAIEEALGKLDRALQEFSHTPSS